MQPKLYYVTRLAGPKVAGRPVPDDGKVMLTEVQARAELLAGTIVEDKDLIEDPFRAPGEPRAPEPAKPGKTPASPSAPPASTP